MTDADSFSIDTEQVGRGTPGMHWFKLYAEFASDPKVQAMPEVMQRRLVMLFCLRCNGDLEKLDDDELALALRITAKDLEKTRELFHKKGFIGDDWMPRNWEKRQSVTDRTAAERMRRYRERLREHDRNVTRNGAVSGDVTLRERSSRAEREREREDSDRDLDPDPYPERKNPLPLDPESNNDAITNEIVQMAAERWGASNGDAIVGDFLREYPAEWVRVACDRSWRKFARRFKPDYIAGILRNMRAEGGPEELRRPEGGPDAGPPPRRQNKHDAAIARSRELRASGYNPLSKFDEPEEED